MKAIQIFLAALRALFVFVKLCKKPDDPPDPK